MRLRREQDPPETFEQPLPHWQSLLKIPEGRRARVRLLRSATVRRVELPEGMEINLTRLEALSLIISGDGVLLGISAPE